MLRLASEFTEYLKRIIECFRATHPFLSVFAAYNGGRSKIFDWLWLRSTAIIDRLWNEELIAGRGRFGCEDVPVPSRLKATARDGTA